MGEMTYCLDTYALIELFQGNPRFADLLNKSFVVSSLTLAEFYSAVRREIGNQEANELFYQLENFSIELDAETLKAAIENRKKAVSLSDAASYAYALKHDYLFVTGDKEFEGMKNVEFRKK